MARSRTAPPTQKKAAKKRPKTAPVKAGSPPWHWSGPINCAAPSAHYTAETYATSLVPPDPQPEPGGYSEARRIADDVVRALVEKLAPWVHCYERAETMAQRPNLVGRLTPESLRRDALQWLKAESRKVVSIDSIRLRALFAMLDAGMALDSVPAVARVVERTEGIPMDAYARTLKAWPNTERGITVDGVRGKWSECADLVTAWLGINIATGAVWTPKQVEDRYLQWKREAGRPLVALAKQGKNAGKT